MAHKCVGLRGSHDSVRRVLRIGSLAVAMVLGLAAGFAPASARDGGATDQVAVLTDAEGTVEVYRGDVQEWSAAERGMRIEVGTTIRTGARSRAVLQIGDGGTVRIGANSQTALVSVATGASAGRVVVLEQLEGHVELELRQRAHHYLKSTVETPHAAVNMRTQFRFQLQLAKVSVDSRGTVVEVATGEAEVEAGGEATVLGSGRSVFLGGRANTGERGATSGPALREASGDQLRERDRVGDCEQDRDRDRDRDGTGGCGGGGCEDPGGRADRVGPTSPPAAGEPEREREAKSGRGGHGSGSH